MGKLSLHSYTNSWVCESAVDIGSLVSCNDYSNPEENT